MSREKTSSEDQLNPIISSTAKSEVGPACIAANRKKGGGSGVVGESGGKTLSMREFFEAGGRAYEVYLSCKDRRPLPDSPVFPTSLSMLSSPTTDNRDNRDNRNHRDVVDQLPPHMLDLTAKNSPSGALPTNPPVVTVIRLTTTSGSPTPPSVPAYTQTPTGPRSRVPFPASSRGPKDIGPQGGFVTADVIDRVIASRLGLPDNGRSSFVVDPFVRKDEKRCFAMTDRHPRNSIPSLCTLTETILTASPVNSSSPSSLSAVSATSPALPSSSSCTSPVEKAQGKPTNDCLKRRLTSHEDAVLAIDLTNKRSKSVDEAHCEAVNQPNVWRKEPTPIDDATIEAGDGKGFSRPSTAGVVPKVVFRSATIFSDVTQWSVDQVVRFVANVQGCREYAEIFRQEAIDGACLIRLSEGHLLNVIRMRLGPALRLRQAIASLCSLDAI